MTDKNDNDDRRGQTRDLISHMLEERKQLLSLMLQASKIQQDNPPQSDLDLLDEFCQVMVDYIAAGHFGLYERIVAGTERRKNVADLALKVYPVIEKTTDLAVAFSEKYTDNKAKNGLDGMVGELSTLGEALATRIDLEDQLIQALTDR